MSDATTTTDDRRLRTPPAPPERRPPAVFRASEVRAGVPVTGEPGRSDLARVRRGVYWWPTGQAAQWKVREQEHLARIAAIHVVSSGQHWFSHSSAALLWGLSVLGVRREVDLTTLIPPRIRGGEASDVRRHWTALPLGDRAERSGLPVTSLERTVVDCARTMRDGAGLVLVDSALRAGADLAVVEDVLRRARGLRGVRRARAVLAMADGLAESPGETLTRHAIVSDGLPSPELQVGVDTRIGRFWVDLGWPEVRVAVEFDGRVKYGVTGIDAAQAVFAEKRRQDALEEAGWMVVRVAWDDLRNPVAIAGRVRGALALRGRD